MFHVLNHHSYRNQEVLNELGTAIDKIIPMPLFVKTSYHNRQR
jgi:hypothetical protein